MDLLTSLSRLLRSPHSPKGSLFEQNKVERPRGQYKGQYKAQGSRPLARKPIVARCPGQYRVYCRLDL
ncbi:hypothetical protein J6590_097357 [Homalodisca vitripennis]|nr:hypothetical protein J6590_097357 [Homalodisca vitripennis]